MLMLRNGSALLLRRRMSATAPNKWVVEMTKDNANEVLSSSSPVVVDLYADWCQPCKMLTPKLESHVAALKGKVTLAKVNVDTQPDIAQSFRVESLPTVLGVHERRMLDSFVGVPSDERLAEFFSKVSAVGGESVNDGDTDERVQESSDDDALSKLTAAELIERAAGEHVSSGDAIALLQMALARDDATKVERFQASVRLSERAHQAGNVEAASAFAKDVRANYSAELELAAHRELNVLLATIEFDIDALESGANEANIDALRKHADANPSDVDARLECAKACFAQSRIDDGVAECLVVLKEDRFNVATKELLFATLNRLGPAHPSVLAARRRLANLMF
jgi:putative thioredoxin